MTYVRKVMAAGLAIIFCIAIVIGTGIILSVRNVNVSYIDYSGNYSKEFSANVESFKKIKGSGLLFVDDEDVYAKLVHGDVIAVESYEKVFPCTINVVLKERVESFAVRTASGYSIYDEDGKHMRSTTDISSVPHSLADGCPDVEVIAEEGKIGGIATLCRQFEDKFGSFRRLVERVTIRKFGYEIASINLRGGTEITVTDWENSSQEKIAKAYEKYCALSDAERLKQTIAV